MMTRGMIALLLVATGVALFQTRLSAQSADQLLLEHLYEGLDGVITVHSIAVFPDRIEVYGFVAPSYKILATAERMLQIALATTNLDVRDYFFLVILDDGYEAVEYFWSSFDEWTTTPLRRTAIHTLTTTPQQQADAISIPARLREAMDSIFPVAVTKFVLNRLSAPVHILPSPASSERFRLHSYQPVEVTGVAQGDPVDENPIWYQVLISGEVGFIHSRYLASDRARAEAGTAFIPAVYVVATRDNVNVRRAASTAAQVITVVRSGTRVQVLDEVEGTAVANTTSWYEVLVNGALAYVHSSLLAPEQASGQ
jgi:SH3-like domain-containing protein